MIILTTNALTSTDLNKRAVGFGGGKRDDTGELLISRFPPEFIGRLDEKILFNPLGTWEMRQIVLMRLNTALGAYRARNIHVTYDTEYVIQYLLGHLKGNKSGARGIQRLVEAKICEPISMVLLDHDNEADLHFHLDNAFFESGKPRMEMVAVV